MIEVSTVLMIILCKHWGRRSPKEDTVKWFLKTCRSRNSSNSCHWSLENITQLEDGLYWRIHSFHHVIAMNEVYFFFFLLRIYSLYYAYCYLLFCIPTFSTCYIILGIPFSTRVQRDAVWTYYFFNGNFRFLLN